MIQNITIEGGGNDRFPTTLDFSMPAFSSNLSFGEIFKDAQDHNLPYYSISIVETKGKITSEYSIYDTSLFAAWYREKKILKLDTLDPNTQLPIQKIHYFAVKCFEFDKDDICRKIDINKEKISFVSLDHSICFEEEEKNITLKHILLDCINPFSFTHDESTNENKMIARISQYCFATFLFNEDNQKYIFPELTGKAREKEIFRWLWCSAKGSNQALEELATTCLSPCGNKLISNAASHANGYLRIRHSIPKVSDNFCSNLRDAEVKAQETMTNLLKNSGKLAEKMRHVIPNSSINLSSDTAVFEKKPQNTMNEKLKKPVKTKEINFNEIKEIKELLLSSINFFNFSHEKSINKSRIKARNCLFHIAKFLYQENSKSLILQKDVNKFLNDFGTLLKGQIKSWKNLRDEIAHKTTTKELKIYENEDTEEAEESEGIEEINEFEALKNLLFLGATFLYDDNRKFLNEPEKKMIEKFFNSFHVLSKN